MECIAIYDELGQATNVVVEKHDAHREGLLHKSVCVWVVNSNNEVLMQKRSKDVMFPSMLDISFSGHVQAGETSIEAVIREGREELGLDIDLSKLQYLFSCREIGEFGDYLENEIDDVFLYKADVSIDQLCFTDQEVESVIYLSISDLQAKVESNDNSLIPYTSHYYFFLNAMHCKVSHTDRG